MAKTKCFPGIYTCFLLVSASFWVHYAEAGESFCNNRVLTYPRVIDMDEYAAYNATFDLHLDWVEIDPGFSDNSGYTSYDASNPLCDSTSFLTRGLGGSVPGPTLTVSPGTIMKIRFRNELTYQPESFSSRVVVKGKNSEYMQTTEMDLTRLGKYNDPDMGSLHFHGLHISNVLPSDDTTLAVMPQEEFLYVINIPEDHQPGLHWIHSHHRGSSSLHLVGGAAMALIIKDPDNETETSISVAETEGSSSGNAISSRFLPPEVRKAEERILVVQDWDIYEALLTAHKAGDKRLMESFEGIRGGESIGQRFVTVNGKYQPIATISRGKWERWRFLYAGWQDLPLDFGITVDGNQADCEFYLLAKDGIYINDYPRGPMLSNSQGYTMLPIPPGGRADFMVRCHNVGGTTRFQALHRRHFFMVNVVEDENSPPSSTLTSNLSSNFSSVSTAFVESSHSASVLETTTRESTLTPWSIPTTDLPAYLQPTQELIPSDGCTCTTKFDGKEDSSRVNEQIYRPGNRFMHTSYLGAVVERELLGVAEHSYHQHVYPFQIIDFPNKETDEGNEFFMVGDWHDTYLDKIQKNGAITIRYIPDIPGKVIVHCHNLLHADSGIIQKEYVRNVFEGIPCQCDIFGPIGGAGIVDDIENEYIIGSVDASIGNRALVGIGVLSTIIMVTAALLQ
jgi:FtsP/CotA-like multicopper oxidase with cupredoxin domain